METTIEKLSGLCEEETDHTVAAQKSRGQQVKICKKELLGKCFKRKARSSEGKIDGEEYDQYVCFTEVVYENKWEEDYYLTAVVIDFNEIAAENDFGVSIQRQADSLSNWLDIVEGAEETSIKDFKDAKLRAYKYVDDLVEKVAEED